MPRLRVGVRRGGTLLLGKHLNVVFSSLSERLDMERRCRVSWLSYALISLALIVLDMPTLAGMILYDTVGVNMCETLRETSPHTVFPGIHWFFMFAEPVHKRISYWSILWFRIILEDFFPRFQYSVFKNSLLTFPQTIQDINLTINIRKHSFTRRLKSNCLRRNFFE